MMIDLKVRWTRGLITIILTAVAVIFGRQHQAFAFDKGDGSSGSPYVIASKADLIFLSENEQYWDDHFSLEADIDLAGVDWVAIGGVTPFTGSFNGNGYTISNLENVEITGNDEGLFGNVEDATIKNIGLNNVDVRGTENVGGLVGSLIDSTIENAYVTGSVGGSSSLGGLVGYVQESTRGNTVVSNSYASVEVTGDTLVGGLIGFIQGYAIVVNSYYNADLTAGSVKGTAVDSADMKQSSTFAGWNFSEGGEGHWGIIEGGTYPMHRTTFDQIVLDDVTVTEDSKVVELEPSFISDRLTYSGRVAADVGSVTVTAIQKSGSSSDVSVNGLSDSENIALNEGENTVNIHVSSAGVALPGVAGDPFELDYILEIIRDNGSAVYPHRIRTAEQLAAIGSSDVFALDHHYELLNDLDLAAEGYSTWDPIGDNAAPFEGQFNDGHHVIYNLNISQEGENEVGLFGYNSGVIQNVGLEGANVVGSDQIGALIGVNAGTVSNVYATGDVSGNSNVGGLIGTSGGDVTNVYFVGTVEGSGVIGGLIGNQTSGTVTSAYWDTDTSGITVSDGGEGKATSEMQQQATYAGWDFTNAWAMMDGTTYPMWKRQWDKVKLSDLQLEHGGSVKSLDPTFSSDQGEYTVTLDSYTTEVRIAPFLPTGSNATIHINSTELLEYNWSPIDITDDNPVLIEITNDGDYIKGYYSVFIDMPAPELIGVTIPENDDYKEGDILTFEISYNRDVTVTGTPRLPLIIGTETVYADYAGQPSEELNKLLFKYEVSVGREDRDGIELCSEIDLPDGVGITVSGANASLVLPDTDTSSIFIDSIAPTIDLTQDPDGDTLTGMVTVTADIDDIGSGIAEIKWEEGKRTASFFAAGGTVLTGDSFDVDSNKIYTVYARDAAGNESVKTIEISNIVSDVPNIHWDYEPSTVTNDPVTISVTAEVYGSGNSLTELRWLSGSHDIADFAAGADIFADGQFTVASNGTYTVYARDAAGYEAVKEISIANIVIAAPDLTLNYSPTNSTDGPVTVSVTASVYGTALGNTLAKLKWMPENHSAEDFDGGTNGTDILTTKKFSVTTNGTYTVYAQDIAGNETVKEISIANIRERSSSGGNDGNNDDNDSSSSTAEDELNFTENADGGVTFSIDPSMIEKETTEDGMIREIVDLTEEAMEQIIEQLEDTEKPFVTIEIDDSEDAVQVQFPADSLFEVTESNPEVVLEVQLNGSSFRLQVNVLDMEHLAEQLGVTIQDMKVQVETKQVIGQEKEQLEQVAGQHGLTLIGKAVDYKITVSAGKQTIEVEDFGRTYMVRAIVLENEKTNQNIVAVWYNPDTQMVHFVPAVFAKREDGKREMEMKVPHNSIYALMESEERTFTDLRGHWAEKDVELLASRLIVQGVTEDRFAPDESITLAEFTALLVRSLALMTEEAEVSSIFVDVDADAWYAPVVETAVEAGLVQGLDADHFAPNEKITREQMAVMIAKAMALTGTSVTETDGTGELSAFTDQDSISPWAKEAVAQSVAAGIINGFSNSTIAPKDFATRAQSVAMLKEFLQYVAFIDEDK